MGNGKWEMGNGKLFNRVEQALSFHDGTICDAYDFHKDERGNRVLYIVLG